MKTRTIFGVAGCILCLVWLSSCTEGAPTWQEQYDLGVKCLSEGNYGEAIIAFEAAIEIDPKQADAYLILEGAYEADGNLDAARMVLEHGLGMVDDPVASKRVWTCWRSRKKNGQNQRSYNFWSGIPNHCDMK